MNPGESLAAFEDFARARGLDLRASTQREGIAAILAFRAQMACPDCADDMLLYQ